MTRDRKFPARVAGIVSDSWVINIVRACTRSTRGGFLLLPSISCVQERGGVATSHLFECIEQILITLQMETFQSIIHAIQPNNGFAVSTYRMPTLILRCICYIRNFYDSLCHRVYQFRAMPFELATAPYLFTLLLWAVCSMIDFQMHISFVDSNRHPQADDLGIKPIFQTLVYLSTNILELVPTLDLTFVGFRCRLDKGLVLPTT